MHGHIITGGWHSLIWGNVRRPLRLLIRHSCMIPKMPRLFTRRAGHTWTWAASARPSLHLNRHFRKNRSMLKPGCAKVLPCIIWENTKKPSRILTGFLLIIPRITSHITRKEEPCSIQETRLRQCMPLTEHLNRNLILPRHISTKVWPSWTYPAMKRQFQNSIAHLR